MNNLNVTDLILKTQEGNDNAALPLLEKYKPLLLKYAVSLHYEDAFFDLQHSFLYLIKNIKLQNFKEQNNAVFTSYISKSIYHDYIRLSKKNRIKELESPVNLFGESSEEDFWNSKLQFNDSYSFDKAIALPPCLTAAEHELIKDLFIYHLSVKDVAKKRGVTSQAVSMLKKSAINKLKKHYTL